MNEFDTNISVSYYLVKLKLIFEFLFAQISLSVYWCSLQGFLYKIHMTEHYVTMTKQILLQFRMQAYIIIPASVGSRRIKI